MDMKTAFLNGVIDKELYIEQPELFEEHGKSLQDYVCLLNKALYGLKQAGRLWYLTLHDHLTENGYERLEAEPCVYIRREGEKIIIIAIYVNDINLASNDEALLQKMKEVLAKCFRMTDLGPIHHILGLHITRDHESISINQTRYTNQLLKKYRMSECHPTSTPLDTSIKLLPLPSDEEPMDKHLYRSAVGSLLHLAIVSRPDIATAVGMVARHIERPGKNHWIAVKRILRYLKGTVSHGLVYRSNNNDQNIALDVFCDADWAGDAEKRKSTTGFVAMMANAAIAWKSVRQECTALSSVEAEYVAAATAAREVVWLRRFLNELGYQQAPTIMRIDNEGARELATNAMISARTKHIELRYHYIRECINNNDIELIHCPSKGNTADIFTKALPEPRFRQCIGEMGVESKNGGME